MSQTPAKPDHGSPPQTPRWVKIFGMILIILVLVVVIMHLTGVDLGSLHRLP